MTSSENQGLILRDPDTFDVKTSLIRTSEAARHHKGLVFFTCGVVLALVTLYVYIWPPIYIAQAKLMAEGADFSRDSFYGGWDVFRKDDPKTEIELMTAGPILKEVVAREKLTYDDVYHPFLSQIAYFWQKSLVGKMYHSVKTKLFPEDTSALSPQDIELIKTTTDLRAGVTVEAVGESNVGELTLKGPSRRVAHVANTMVSVYMARRMERHLLEAQKSYDALTTELGLADTELKGIEARRLAFTQAHALNFDLQKENLELSKLTELETGIAGSQAKIAMLSASLSEIERQLAAEPTTRTISAVTELNSVREATKRKRLDLQTALIEARDHYREDSPEVQEAERDLAKLDTMLAEEPPKIETATTEGLNLVRQDLVSKRDATRSELEGTRAGLAVMQETAASLRGRLSEVPALQTTLRDLDRELGSSAERYHAIQEKQAQAAASLLTSKTAMPSLRVVEYAAPPAEKYWPKTKILYPIALAVGLLFGVCAAVIKSSFDGLVRKEHVERGRPALPFYGTITIPTRRLPLAVTSRAVPAANSSSDRARTESS